MEDDERCFMLGFLYLDIHHDGSSHCVQHQHSPIHLPDFGSDHPSGSVVGHMIKKTMMGSNARGHVRIDGCDHHDGIPSREDGYADEDDDHDNRRDWVPYVWSWMQNTDEDHDHHGALDNIDWTRIHIVHRDHRVALEMTMPIMIHGGRLPSKITKSNVGSTCIADLMFALSDKSMIEWYKGQNYSRNQAYLTFYDHHDMEVQLSCASFLDHMDKISQSIPWVRVLDGIFRPLRNYQLEYSETPRLRRLVSPCENLIMATIPGLVTAVARLWFNMMHNYFGLVLHECHACAPLGGEYGDAMGLDATTLTETLLDLQDWPTHCPLIWHIPERAPKPWSEIADHVHVLMDMTDQLVAVGLSPLAMVTITCFTVWSKHDLQDAHLVSMWRSRLYRIIFAHYSSPWFYASCFYKPIMMMNMLRDWMQYDRQSTPAQ